MNSCELLQIAMWGWWMWSNPDSPAVHYDGYIRDSGLPDMVQHADQGCGVLGDSVVRPTSEEVVVQGVGLWWVTSLHTWKALPLQLHRCWSVWLNRIGLVESGDSSCTCTIHTAPETRYVDPKIVTTINMQLYPYHMRSSVWFHFRDLTCATSSTRTS